MIDKIICIFILIFFLWGINQGIKSMVDGYYDNEKKPKQR